jgi:thiamine-monophosphate kinase
MDLQRTGYATAMQIGDLGEFNLIERLLQHVGEAGPGVTLGAGDDTAAIKPSTGMLLLATCDSQVEGHHFEQSQISPEQLGRRLAAVNLSDIAAMGGQPRWALVSLCLPPSTEIHFIEAVYRGLTAELNRFATRIVGGNITASELLMLDLTLLGEVPPSELLRRGGARPGDTILVSGHLGSSAAGRAALNAGLDSGAARVAIEAHLTPQPRVAVGRIVAASGFGTAMIDVSDGFAQDLGHICDASGTGAIVQATALPIAAGAQEVAIALGLDVLQLALSGGEDYELIVTAPADLTGELAGSVEREAGVVLTRVGTIVSRTEGRWLEQQDGRRVPLVARGWQHFGRAP